MTERKTLSITPSVQTEELQAKIDKQKNIEKHEAMNKQASELKKQQSKDAWEFLLQRFSKCFMPNNPLPLKLHIEHDIFEDKSIKDKLDLKDFTKTSIRDALIQYCRSKAYHRSVLANNDRIDLSGNKAGDVTLKEKEYSQIRLDVINKKITSKKPRKQ